MIKLLLFISIALVGTAIVIKRKISSAARSQSQAFLINKIKRDPSAGQAYAGKLDIPMYKKENVSQAAFDLIKEKIQSSATIGDYKILYTAPVSDQLLIFTEITFTDFDVTMIGDAGDVKKKGHYNFLMRHHAELNELELYSTMYADLNEKLHMQGFIDALMKTTA
ncbi:MAG: hypothetical protein U0U09_14335 [Cyclobacteriaceae bacterium]